MTPRPVLIGLAWLACLMSYPGAAALAQDLPISKAEAKRIEERGTLSGYGQRCGLDWQQLNFLPMMRHWRSQGKSEKQMAFIGAWHGAAQGQALRSAPPCTDETSRTLIEKLTFKP